MAETPINLNKARKARARAEARRQADANAVKFGRSKADKAQAAAETERAERVHGAHRLSDPRPDEPAAPETQPHKPAPGSD